MPNLQQLLTDRLTRGFRVVAEEPADPVLRRSDRADFQANGALGLARRLGRTPREIAGEVINGTELGDVCAAVEVAGAGFINLTIADGVLGSLATEMAGQDRLGVELTDRPDVVVVDYSAPNVAKEMHVGHLRSTIIGDAAVRLLEWRGHTVVRQNHIGEWGTPFGMLIEHLLDIGEAEAAHELAVGDLDGFYKQTRAKFDTSAAFQERSRRRVVALQSGDEQTMRLWRELVAESQRYFLSVYDRLDVRLTPADFAGESTYNDQLAGVAEELDQLGLLHESKGALCVFPAGFTNRDGDPLPMIVRKSDGGFGYDTTDLAALRHRVRDLNGTRLLYVIGLPQAQHLQMLFQVGRQAGWLTPPTRAEHIGHGSILGTDAKMLRSRSGSSVKLVDLLDEAVSRAADAVGQKNPRLAAGEAGEVARAVGIGAVKYADLSVDRAKDYVFDLNRMLSFDGNTAPYLQYAHARIHSIFRRADTYPAAWTGPIIVSDPAEHDLAIELLGFEPLIVELERSLEFHRLCGYLFQVATAFTTFYERCPVLRVDDQIRTSRLSLCALTARVLAHGLGLLGINTPDRM